MTETEQLADVIALVVHAETAPIAAKVAALETRSVIAPESIEAVKDIAAALSTRVGALEARAPIPGPIGPVGEKGLDGGPGRDGKDGASVTPDDMRPLIVAEVVKAVAAIPPAKDGAPGPPGRDGRDGQSIQGPRGEKGADGRQGDPIPGLAPDVLTASADVLLRKEFAALDAAAPPRVIKRVIRDARGKIERVIEEPTRG